MAQISRRYLNQKTQERIFSLFLSSIILTQSRDAAVNLVEDILTPTERVVLSKRFSIAFMLLEGYNYDTISEALKVSSSTVGTVAIWLKTKGKGFRVIHKKIKRNDTFVALWEDIKEGVLDILASSHGTDWKQSKRILRQHRLERKKSF